jgi:hypothetical protein
LQRELHIEDDGLPGGTPASDATVSCPVGAGSGIASARRPSSFSSAFKRS